MATALTFSSRTRNPTTHRNELDVRSVRSVREMLYRKMGRAFCPSKRVHRHRTKPHGEFHMTSEYYFERPVKYRRRDRPRKRILARRN